MVKLLTVGIVGSIALVTILMFGLIFHSLAEGSWFIVWDTGRSSLSFGESMWVSVSNATLAGVGDIVGVSTAARGWMATQVTLTGFGLVYLIATSVDDNQNK